MKYKFVRSNIEGTQKLRECEEFKRRIIEEMDGLRAKHRLKYSVFILFHV